MNILRRSKFGSKVKQFGRNYSNVEVSRSGRLSIFEEYSQNVSFCYLVVESLQIIQYKSSKLSPMDKFKTEYNLLLRIVCI